MLELFESFHRYCRVWTLVAGTVAGLSAAADGMATPTFGQLDIAGVIAGTAGYRMRKDLAGRLADLRKLVVQEVMLDGCIDPSVLFMVDRYLAPGYLAEALRPEVLWLERRASITSVCEDMIADLNGDPFIRCTEHIPGLRKRMAVRKAMISAVGLEVPGLIGLL